MGNVVTDRYVRERMMLYAQNNPKRYAGWAALIGTIFGLPLGTLLAVVLEGWPLPWPTALLPITGMGIACGACPATVMFYSLRRIKPLPPDTDLAQLRTALKLVGVGVPGADPATNALAARVAEQTLSYPQWTKTITVGFLGLTGLGVFVTVQRIQDDNAEALQSGAFTLYAVAGLVLTQVMAARQNRNATKLRDAVLHDNTPRPNEEPER